MIKQHFPTDIYIQSLIQARINEKRAIGIVVGIIEPDGSHRCFAAGDAGTDAQPLCERSVFEIGSITKTFTGILLADMVTRQEVALDDPVAKFLPKNLVTVPRCGNTQITLLDLCTHRSALPPLPDNFAPDDETNPYLDYTVDQLYEFLSNHQLGRSIGAKAEYSNLGVGLLGHALALAKGRSYETLILERILDPLEMRETAISLNAKMKHWLALGHDPVGNVVPNWDLPTFEGAGALRSNLQDMLKFLSANINQSESPLEAAIRISHEVHNPFGENEDIGLNWFILKLNDDKIIWHDGGTGGYQAFAGIEPDKRIGVVILSNSCQDINDIGLHLINQKNPLTKAPSERIEVNLPRSLLETYVGDYQLEEDFILSVSLDEVGLQAQATGQSKIQIYPESQHQFFYKVIDAQINFELNNSGKVVALVLHQGGMVMRAGKS